MRQDRPRPRGVTLGLTSLPSSKRPNAPIARSQQRVSGEAYNPNEPSGLGFDGMDEAEALDRAFGTIWNQSRARVFRSGTLSGDSQ